MARQRAEGHSDAIRRARLATDTDLATERVRGDDYAAANERLVALAEASKDDLRAERDRLHNLFMQAPAILCVLRGPSHVYELVNPIYRKVIGGRDVVGKPIREALPELEGLGISSSATSRVAS